MVTLRVCWHHSSPNHLTKQKCHFIRMVRELKEVLQLLGWGNGFRLPIANESNKQLEKTVEELLKKKAEMIVNIETINEKREAMKKNLKAAEFEQKYNQTLLNGFSQQLSNDIKLLKLSESTQNQRHIEMKGLRKEIKHMEESIEKLRADINNNTNKMNTLKESLQWGEDAIFAWEEEVNKRGKENEILQKFKMQDEERFQKLDLERKQVEADLNDSKELESKEADRCRVLTLQLENVSKLYKEAYNERNRLMKVWHDSINACYNREEENKRLIEELCDIRNKARNKCTELYEHKKFDENLQRTNDSTNGEILKYEAQNNKLKEQVSEIEEMIKQYNLEKDIRKKTVSHISGKIESERMKSTELQAKNKARLIKYNKIIETISNLQQQFDVLKVDAMTNEQKYRNAEDMYEMSCKASDEESREMERLYVFGVQLRHEINTLKEQESIKRKDLTLMKKLEKDLEKRLKDIQNELDEAEARFSIVLTEDTVLKQQITEIQDKCSGKEEKEEIEAELKLLEPQEASLIKENVIVRMRLKNLQREYRDKISTLRHGKEEIASMMEHYKCQRMQLYSERKFIDEVKEELQKKQLQLNLLLMKENSIKENMAQYDSTVCKLERQRLILEAAMKERKQEIEAEYEVLLGKKKTFLEEKAMLGRTVEHLNLRINQIQSKYSLTLDLLEKDESGKQLSIAHFKIKLAQEKYDLQCQGDDLEAKINKTENEILAMENTLKLLGAANENYKVSLESGSKDDPEIIERESMERKLLSLKKTFKEDSELLESVKNEIQILQNDITKIKCIAKELEDDWKVKEKEVTALEKDLANKQHKLSRATAILSKLLKEIKKVREPAGYRKMAQRDISNKIQEERNKSVLQQLSELSQNYVETKPLVNRYLNEYGLRLPNKFAGCRSMGPNYGLDSARSKVSARSDSSVPSVVNLDPEQLFSNESLPGNKRSYNKYLY